MSSLSQETLPRHDAEFSTELYQYSPLPKPTSIRLMKFLGEDEQGLIRCALETWDIEDPSLPSYHALSYTWGNPHPSWNRFSCDESLAVAYAADGQWPIVCNNRILYVRQNLYDAFQQLPKCPWVFIKDFDSKKTWLHNAAEKGDATLAWALINDGADVNSKDRCGKTPLHYAAENGHFEVAKMLVHAGCEIFVADFKNKTSFDLSQQNNNFQISMFLAQVEFWLQHGHKRPEFKPWDRASIPVWIDAICIDQGNVAERSSQVQIMDRIYNAALTVTVWLGREDEYAARAIQVIKELATAHENLWKRNLKRYAGNYPDGILESRLKLYANNDADLLSGADTPSISQAEWDALSAFFQRQWFRRAWVVQEVVLGKEIQVFCGHSQVDWADLGRATGAIDSRLGDYPSSTYNAPPRVVLEQTSFMHLKALRGLQTMRHYGRDVSGVFNLQSLMNSFWTFDATDPRDKIYALLGLCRIGQEHCPVRIDPDYSKSVPEVYVTAVKVMIEDHKNLWSVAHAQDKISRQIDGLPSWVPDFTVEQGGRFSNLYKAAGSLPMPIHAAKSWSILTVSGLRWDIIAQTGHQRPRVSSIFDFDGSWFDLTLHLNPVYNTGQQRTEVLWRTLCGDFVVEHGDKPPEYRCPAPAYFKDQFRDLVCSMICKSGEEPLREYARLEEYHIQRFGPAHAAVYAASYISALGCQNLKKLAGVDDLSLNGPLYDDMRPFFSALNTLGQEPNSAVPTVEEIEDFRLKNGCRPKFFHNGQTGGHDKASASAEDFRPKSESRQKIFRDDSAGERDKSSSFIMGLWQNNKSKLKFFRNDGNDKSAKDSVFAKDLPPKVTSKRRFFHTEPIAKCDKEPSSAEPFQTKDASNSRVFYDGPIGDQDKPSSFVEAFKSAYRMGKLFRTDKNYLGLGPESIEEGDEVWILPGANAPFILRKRGTDAQTYHLVGEAYVHGIMFGEVVNSTEPDFVEIDIE